MSQQLLPNQVSQWREIFRLFDQSGDNLIEMRELGTILRALGQNPTDAELQDMINDVDVDGSGKLDFAEFINIMTGRMKDTDTKEELAYAFGVFDTDKDGVLTASNLSEAMEKIGETFNDVEIHEIIKELDVDGNGRVAKSEFLEIMLAI
eukprot:g3725.t1